MSTLSQQIFQDLTRSMKERNAALTTVLRSLSSAVKYAVIETGGAGGEPSDALVIQVLRKQIKQRQDSLASFREAGREDLAATEENEIALLNAYLPPSPSLEEIQQAVSETVQALGASSRADMGRVMAALQERFGGSVENRTLSQVVRESLG
ncbi:MAG TPA: GatB/YqeY domain-containing protein [Verrucomicrobiales bacterium]|nr:GatB/YqeY domain-containing protein [Verrucomicrobiales bacterium]